MSHHTVHDGSKLYASSHPSYEYTSHAVPLSFGVNCCLMHPFRFEQWEVDDDHPNYNPIGDIRVWVSIIVSLEKDRGTKHLNINM